MRALIKAPLAALAALLALTACATPQASPAPQRCGPDITAAPIPEPLIPDNAGVPRPVTAEEADALAEYLHAVGRIAEWGRMGWAAIARERARCVG